MNPDLSSLLALLTQHKWLAAAALVIGLLVRLVKDDKAVAWFPVTIPSRYRPLLALGLGIASGILQRLADGPVAWPDAIVGGVVSAALAMGGHAVMIEAARGGRELGVPKTPAPAAPKPPPLMLLTMAATSLLMIVVFVVTPCTLTGCAALTASLPTVLAYVTSAGTVLDLIQQVVGVFFKLHNDPNAEAEVDKAVQDTRLALLTAENALQGGENLTQNQIDAAFADFKTAFTNLLALLAKLGVPVQVQSGLARAQRAPNGVLLVPSADDLIPKVRR